VSWLSDWDPLVHGTAVFGAAVPFAVAALLARLIPGRAALVVLIAVAVSFLWLFGIPALPPESSDDAVVSAWLVAAVVACARRWWLRALLGVALWFALAWWLYPAWLAMDGGAARKVLVAGGLALTVVVAGLLAERIHIRAAAPVSALAFVPVGVGLAVLLQLGGSTQFAQSGGALAAALAGWAVVAWWRDDETDSGSLPAAWLGLVVFLGWCGWLFAEIRYGLAALLLLGPPAALLRRMLPSRGWKRWQVHGFDFLVASLVVGSVVAIAVVDYLGEEASGY